MIDEIKVSAQYRFTGAAGAEVVFRAPSKAEIDSLRAYWDKPGKINVLYVALKVSSTNEPTITAELEQFRVAALYALFQEVMRERNG